MTRYYGSIDNSRRRYRRAENRAWSGIWCRSYDGLCEVVLTTREGDDNTWGNMCHDVKLLIQRLRDKGIKVEYVLGPELTPGKGLLHLHGFVAIEYRALSLVELQLFWSEIHGAPQVWFVSVSDKIHENEMTRKGKGAEYLEGVVNYMVKHMLKDYPEAVGFKGKLLISRGWMPSGWQPVRKVLVAWALEHYSWNAGKEEVKAVWHSMAVLYRRWCRGERIAIKVGGCLVSIEGKEIEGYDRP